MSHAKSLRVIGQSLEAAQVPRFKLTKDAESYQLWIAKYQFCFSPGDIARLDAQAQKRRVNRIAAPLPPKTLSQQLRALGTYLDRIDVRSFRLVWTADFAILEYENSVNKSGNSRVFTAEELRQLGLRRKLSRSTPYLAQQLNP